MINKGCQKRMEKCCKGQKSAKEQHAICREILFPEPSPAAKKDLARFFGEEGSLPGTCSIGDRKDAPELFQDTLDAPIKAYDFWVYQTTIKALKGRYGGCKPFPLSLDDVRGIVSEVEHLLDYETEEGILLCDAIPQQMYEDVFHRILDFILGAAEDRDGLHPYSAFNDLCRRIGFSALENMEKMGLARGRTESIDRLIQVSVLAGYVGINLKSTASAASALLNRNQIPVPKRWVADIEAPAAVSRKSIDATARHLVNLAWRPEGRFGLESLRSYREEVISGGRKTLLVFFCDDYLESIIDMKRMEVLLKINPRLRVLFVPRAGRYGNDLAASDVWPLLKTAPFSELRRFKDKGRIHFSEKGPRAGCIDPRNISAELISEIDRLGAGRTILLETKGCRNFEMLKGGLPVPWYSSFNCNRALSIRTVEIDGAPVFLRIPPGLRAYDRFDDPRIGPSDLYPETQVRFARMTTRDLYAALNSSAYTRLSEKWENEMSLNRALIQKGDEEGLTFSELMDHRSKMPIQRL